MAVTTEKAEYISSAVLFFGSLHSVLSVAVWIKNVQDEAINTYSYLFNPVIAKSDQQTRAAWGQTKKSGTLIFVKELALCCFVCLLHLCLFLCVKSQLFVSVTC